MAQNSLFLLRALLPSWKFFEDFGPTPRLQYRFGTGNGQWSAWQDALPPCRRSITSLLLNAPGNLRLAYGSLVEHLVDDINSFEAPSAKALAEMTSYRLVRALVHFQVYEQKIQGPLPYQFKIVGVPENSPSDVFEDVFVSQVHED